MNLKTHYRPEGAAKALKMPASTFIRLRSVMESRYRWAEFDSESEDLTPD